MSLSEEMRTTKTRRRSFTDKPVDPLHADIGINTTRYNAGTKALPVSIAKIEAISDLAPLILLAYRTDTFNMYLPARDI